MASMIPVDLEPDSPPFTDSPALAGSDCFEPHVESAAALVFTNELGVVAVEEDCKVRDGSIVEDLTRGGGVSSSSSLFVGATVAQPAAAFGQRHVDRIDIGDITIVVGLTVDNVAFLPYVPWHSIIVGLSGTSTDWVCTGCARGPFSTVRLPTASPLSIDVPLPMFAARNTFVDCLRFVKYLELLDWSLLVVDARFVRPTCARHSLKCAALQSHRLAVQYPDAPGLWRRVAATLVAGHVRVLSCMLEVGLDVFVVAAFLVPQLDALGVSCRLVSRSSNCRCGIFVLGMHGDIKGLARDLPAPGMGRHSGPLSSVFDKALPKARVKSVAQGEFLGLWFADVARRSAAAVASRAAGAEWRALQAGSKAGKKRSRDVDAVDL